MEKTKAPSVPTGQGTRRRRDFIVLTAGAFALLLLLYLTGALGWIEWITASIVAGAGSSAYFVSTQPPPLPPAQASSDVEKNSELKPLRQRIKALISSLPFPTLLIGADKRIERANQPARAIFRLLNQATGLLANAALRHPQLLEAIDRVSKTAAAEQLEMQISTSSETWLAHIQAGPDPQSVLVVFEDRTAVRRAEQARADFMANASHELRTPLTSISGFIETMMGPAKDDKASWDRFLNIMDQQTKRMDRLVDDLLSLSRIEFSEHQTPSTRVDMTELTQRAVRTIDPIAAGETGRISLRVPRQTIDVIADSEEIFQVVQNFCTNAIKYGDGGEIKVILGASETMLDAETLAGRQTPNATRATLLAPRASSEVPACWLRIENTGEGISKTHLPRLGERFYRVDSSRGGTIKGTGLGLAIVKHIMARHRGGLAVESVKDEGAAFGIWLPLADAAPD